MFANSHLEWLILNMREDILGCALTYFLHKIFFFFFLLFIVHFIVSQTGSGGKKTCSKELCARVVYPC